MKRESITYRKMKAEDLQGGLKLSVAEGWNQTEKDWKFLIEDPMNVCVIAEYHQQIIGTTTVINYNDKSAWVGMVLVDNDFRGLGVSKALLNLAFDELKNHTSIKLDATVKGLPVYKKFDFNSEYSILRLLRSSNNLNENLSNETNLIKEIQPDNLEAIISLDEQVFGVNRSKLIRYLFREFPNKAWWFKNKNHVEGFLLGREGYKYHHIGPVIAKSTLDAKLLIQKALIELEGYPVILDILSDKEDLIQWLISIGFTKQRKFVRMYKTENPYPGMVENLYCICGPEFG